MLTCSNSVSALDIWSAGIILLAFLSGKFPLFNSNDDTEALAEIAAIVGRERMEKCARLHSTSFCFTFFSPFAVCLGPRSVTKVFDLRPGSLRGSYIASSRRSVIR